MIFSYFTSISSSGAICRKADWDRLTTSENTIGAITDFRNGNPNAKKKLAAICFHAFFPQGKRKIKEAQASGIASLDIDHASPEELKRIAEAAIPSDDEKDTSPVLLVHITPSGKGLRVVFKATKTGEFATCESMSDFQHTMAKKLSAEHLLDEVCHDLTRLSFVPQASDVLYINHDRLFNEPAEVTSFAASTPVHYNSAAKPPPSAYPESTQTSYDGVPLKDIFECYISITGGMPQEGGRNSRYYAAVRDLRYICDFNPKVIATHLPDCGLPPSEVFELCASACQSSRATSLPEIVTRAIAIVKFNAEEERRLATANEIPVEKGIKIFAPSLIREFLNVCPQDFQEATLMALLPILGTLATRLRGRYLDGEIHSPSFFSVISSEQASGKSFARRLVKQLLKPIAEEDAKEREIELKYKEKLKQKKNAKEQPEQPRVKIRMVPASISIAKLLQRLDFAEGDHLFSFAEEMDTLIKSNKSGAWSEKNDLYRNGFDNSEYGQDFMSENSYSANLAVYYNLLVLGTPRQTERFFSDVENGLVSRCCFAYLPDQFGAKLPRFKQMTDADQSTIDQYVQRLREAHGEVDLSFLYPSIDHWLEEQRLLAISENNRARDIFRRRSAVIGFRAVLTVSPLYDLSDKKNQKLLSAFACQVADITLKNQLQFAGEKLNELIQPEDHQKSNMYSIIDELPEEFVVEDLVAILRKRGMKTRPRQIIYLWTKNNLIESTGAKTYKKLH